MNFATLIFPGNFLPHHVVEYAINWAKENEGSLVVLFILNKREQPDDDMFRPIEDNGEELALVANSASRVRPIDAQEIRYLEKRAGASHIPLRCEILYSPTIKFIYSKLNRSDLVFIDKNLDEHPPLLEGLGFTIDDLREKTIANILEIGDFDRYSDVVY